MVINLAEEELTLKIVSTSVKRETTDEPGTRADAALVSCTFTVEPFHAIVHFAKQLNRLTDSFRFDILFRKSIFRTIQGTRS